MQLSAIDVGEKRPELQQLLSQVDGLNFELLKLADRMDSTQLPPIPDIEEVHFAIDKCQVLMYILYFFIVQGMYTYMCILLLEFIVNLISCISVLPSDVLH